MASITWWNRLEPRPRATDVGEALAARVRDPAWILARQWQLGEFRGEDAGSPAFARFTTATAPFVSWSVDGGPPKALDAARPLEAQVESEPFTPTLALRIELGQLAEQLLADGAGAAVAAAFRDAWTIDLPDESVLASDPDPDEARLLRVCAERVLDGTALYEAAVAALPGLPPKPPVAAGDQAAVLAALGAFRAWVDEVYGAVGLDDAPAWRPERLEYGVQLGASRPDGQTAAFSAQPRRDGELDWASLDERAAAPAIPAPGAPERLTASIFPTHVRFRGMPNHRFWDFESGRTDFGALTLDTRDVGKMVVVDFMLVQGNDWFAIALDQPVGTLQTIEELAVHDVFGGVTPVPRADQDPGPPGARWTLFSVAHEDDPALLGDYLALLPCAGPGTLVADAVEEVRFLRDRMANMAWAVEHTTEDQGGEPWPGAERDLAGTAPAPPAPAATVSGVVPPPSYVIQSAMPRSWFPLVPIALPPYTGEITLEVGAMVRAAGGGGYEEIPPSTRILAPGGTAQPYRIREEEVPRTGTRVARIVHCGRWIDGSTHLWVARRRSPGAGEGASGLRFDVAER